LTPLDVTPVVDAARIREACNRLEALWDASLYPDKVVCEGRAIASEGSRPPIPIGGISLRADIARRLHYWADLATTQSGGLPKLQNLSNLSAIAAVRWNADWLAQHDPATGRDGTYLADELEDHAGQLEAHTLPAQPTPDNEIGTCPQCGDGRLVKPSASTLLQCTGCGRRAEVWEWWERRFPALAEDVTQQDIAERYGVPAATARKWVERHGLRAQNPGQRPLLYRWAQVRWVLEYGTRKVA
jgi:hypothetical protein